ncbi:MAG: hypothetical protein RID42_00300 [Alphaproteobacteria bacterium]
MTDPNADPAAPRYWTNKRLGAWIRWWLFWPIWFYALASLAAAEISLRHIAGW